MFDYFAQMFSYFLKYFHQSWHLKQLSWFVISQTMWFYESLRHFIWLIYGKCEAFTETICERTWDVLQKCFAEEHLFPLFPFKFVHKFYDKIRNDFHNYNISVINVCWFMLTLCRRVQNVCKVILSCVK